MEEDSVQTIAKENSTKKIEEMDHTSLQTVQEVLRKVLQVVLHLGWRTKIQTTTSVRLYYEEESTQSKAKEVRQVVVQKVQTSLRKDLQAIFG